MDKTVIIIGAGITGLCCAEHLRRAGFVVTLVDALMPGDPAQASYGNAGLLARAAITPASEPGLLTQLPALLFGRNSPLNLRWSYLPKLLPWALPFLRNGFPDRLRQIVPAIDALTHDCVDQHIALAKGTAAEQFITPCELTYLYPRVGDYNSKSFLNRLKSELGCEYSLLDAKTLHERDPNLGDSYALGVSYKHNGSITDPGGYCRALFTHFTTHGGVFNQNNVVAITDSGVTLGNGETLVAEQVVVCAGAFSGGLTKSLGHKTPVQGERGYHLFIKDPSFSPEHPYLLTDARCGVTPMANGLRIAGTTEFAKLGAPANMERTELLRRAAKRLYPTLTWRVEETWMGNRPSTPDSLPMIGRTTKHPNIIYAFGSQHLGLTIGPKIGRIVTQIAADRSPNQDIIPYDVARFD